MMTPFFVKKDTITLLLIASLLVLRIPFIVIIDAVFGQSPSWATGILEIGMYVLIGVLMWIKRDGLKNFHINTVSVWVYILSGTILRLDLSLTTPIFWVTGLYIFWLLVKGRLAITPIKKEDFLWILYSLFLGYILSITISSFLNLLNPIKSITTDQKPGFIFGLALFLYELSHVALPEEMIFRGFLWGHLQNMGWTETKILVFQAGLFWLAHLNYFEKPYTFWIAIPLMSAFLGLVVWRSRSVTASIITHAAYNSMRFFIA